ncbi:MAG: hypothetical protein ACK5V3_18665, partial [Bdellovibrionales bacterium]
MGRLLGVFGLLIFWASLGLAQVLSPLYKVQDLHSNLNAPDRLIIENFFNDAETRLPSKVRMAFPEGINVRFVELAIHIQGRAQ